MGRIWLDAPHLHVAIVLRAAELNVRPAAAAMVDTEVTAMEAVLLTRLLIRMLQREVQAARLGGQAR